MRVHAIALVAVLASVALAGCFDPHRVQVPDAVLDASPLDWNVTRLGQEGKQFGSKSVETRYVFAPATGPPYPGVLQVFGLRGDAVDDLDQLEALANDVVTRAANREGIQIDGSQDQEGERTLANGKATRWFSHTGRIESSSSDSIFLPGGAEHLVVKVHGEVGYDGRSKTGFIAIAFVQVGTHSASPLPGLPDTQESDERTWFEVVADPQGGVGGASLPAGRGLIHNLRTHG